MVIGTGREEEEEGEKVDLKICSASVRDKSTDHYGISGCGVFKAGIQN